MLSWQHKKQWGFREVYGWKFGEM